MQTQHVKIISESNAIAEYMLQSDNRFIRNLGLELKKKDIWQIIDMKLRIDRIDPELWDRCWSEI